MWVGAHLSIGQGLTAAVHTAVKIGANTLQFFMRNPRGGKMCVVNKEDYEGAWVLMREHDFGPLVAHAPYTYNLASAKENVRAFSQFALKEDLQRMRQMEVPFLVLHPGSHVGQGEEKGSVLVVEALKQVLADLPVGIMILLESMAGQGSELGYKFEHLAQIIEGCENHPGLGVCLDSCHLTAAGYDLSTWTKFKGEFSKFLEWERIKVFHLNDSQHPLGSRKDRHAKLGEGYLGWEMIADLLGHLKQEKWPLILETPQDLDGYAGEIKEIKKVCR